MLLLTVVAGSKEVGVCKPLRRVHELDRFRIDHADQIGFPGRQAADRYAASTGLVDDHITGLQVVGTGGSRSCRWPCSHL